MQLLPYMLSTTNELLTSRAGLICVGQLMASIGFEELVDKHFPTPGSNRGFAPSVFVNSIILMLHEGGKCLDDISHIKDDTTLRMLMGLKEVPESDSVGDWLRRLGQTGVESIVEVNKTVLQLALHRCRKVTLDIDAALSPSGNKSAQWTYKKCKGYMPMIGNLAETRQIVAVDFREGNVAPATRNLEFIHQCEAALPSGVYISALRIDAAGYQAAIIDECIDRSLKFAIRAKMSSPLQEMIREQDESCWNPLMDKNGRRLDGEFTTRIIHTMENSQHAFNVVVQRQVIEAQKALALGIEQDEGCELFHSKQYIYRAIAVSEISHMSDSDWVHWYNGRAEDSENRIKELKADFAAERMPCQNFDANALYFSLCALAFNLFSLMRMYFPDHLENARAKTIRYRLYAIAGKVVRHGRQVFLKLQSKHHDLLSGILTPIQQLAQAP